jgi:glycosyltransferase involved in cell wall biosynthesis
VITTRTNGFSEAIEEGVHGSVVDGTPDGVANAIRDWSAPQRRHSARPLILERAARFDISRNVDRTLEVLLRAAADKHIAIARR